MSNTTGVRRPTEPSHSMCDCSVRERNRGPILTLWAARQEYTDVKAWVESKLGETLPLDLWEVPYPAASSATVFSQ